MAAAVFVFTFFAIVNRYWIRSFFEGFIKQPSKPEDLKDNKIKLLDTKTTRAMMAGLPWISIKTSS